VSDAPLLHYEVHGERGPFVLVVHGFLSSRAQWLPNVDALAAIARPVVVELFGHGRSPSPEDPAWYTPAGYVEAFERVRQALGAERWLVIGQSLGAALTLRYALEHPQRFIAHVFTNSTAAFAEEGWGDGVRPAMEAQAQRLRSGGRAVLDDHPLNPARGSRLPQAVLDAFRIDSALLDPSGIANTGLYTIPESSVRASITANSVPTLLVVGEREERFVPHRRYAEAHMPELGVAALDGGHAVNIDAAAAFNEAVLAFFNRHI
jgi:2-succinyl-6-hydroxy-2,4-cyclohexadiene-1-carboxylate synthase